MSRAVVLAVAILCPRAASGQFEGFLDKVNDLNFFFSCWHPRGEIERRGECLAGKNGYGLEVLFDVGQIKLRGTRDSVVSAGKFKQERKSVTLQGNAVTTRIDSVWTAPVTTQTRSLQLEVALGYSQFSGFRSRRPSIDLRGTVREVPSVAVYGTFNFLDFGVLFKYLSPYVGVKSGFIELSNVQALIPGLSDTVITYTGTAKAFQFGGAYGLVFSPDDRLHFFIEQVHQIRRLPHVQWDGPVKGKISQALPRALDFSGPTLSAGLQITIKQKE